MRYSIIHHDVREKFKLTICEYLVCDSIHQLGHYQPCQKSNKEIGKFIGFGDWAVGNAKKTLTEKKLVFLMNGIGYATTKKWHEAITYASVKITTRRENHDESRENHDDTIYNNSNNLGANAQKDSESVIEVAIDGDGDIRDPKPVRERKDTSYLTVFPLFGRFPANWKMNRTQIQAAKNLLSERGIEQIKNAIRFLRENRDHEFCPSITSPYDLDSKWSKLFAFKKKFEL